MRGEVTSQHRKNNTLFQIYETGVPPLPVSVVTVFTAQRSLITLQLPDYSILFRLICVLSEQYHGIIIPQIK